MLRCVTRNIPHAPALPLAFLYPRFYASSNVRYPRVSTRTRKHLGMRPSYSAVPTPSQALADAGEAWLANEKLGTLGEKVYRIWNEHNVLLRRALQDHDLHTAWEHWSVLANEHLLRFFGPPQYSQYARALAEIQAEGFSQESFSQEDIAAMEEMMVYTAAGDYLLGLKARMQYLLHQRDADAVLRLFSRYVESMKENGLRFEKEEDQVPTTSKDVETDEEGVLDIWLTAPTRQIRPEMLLYAITAFAMKDCFREAMDIGLRTSTVLNISALQYALSELRPIIERHLGHKVDRYMRRIRLAKLLSFHASFSKHLSNLVRDKADKAVHTMYTDALQALRDPDSGIVLEPSAVSERSPILFPEFAWASFLSAFLARRNFQLAEQLWDDMASFRIRPSADVWVALLDGYAKLRMNNHARQAWSVMLQQGQSPTPMMYRALIHGEFLGRHYGEAMKRFRAFETAVAKGHFQSDIPTILVVYNTVIHGLLSHNKESEALEIIKCMQEKGPAPDVITFNTLMRHYAMLGNLRALAETLQSMSTAGLSGDVFTFSIVLTALVPVRKDAIQVVLDIMRKHNIEPNVAMYTSIIVYLLKQETEATFRAAMDLLYKMEASASSDIQPNTITYTSILALLHRRSWLDQTIVEETTQSVTEKMMQRNLLSSRVTYNILIKACLDNPAPEGITNALRYFTEMHDRRIFINSDTWYILLSGLRRRKEWGLANELVDEITNSELVPTVSLLDLMRKVRQGGQAHQTD